MGGLHGRRTTYYLPPHNTLPKLWLVSTPSLAGGNGARIRELAMQGVPIDFEVKEVTDLVSDHAAGLWLLPPLATLRSGVAEENRRRHGTSISICFFKVDSDPGPYTLP